MGQKFPRVALQIRNSGLKRKLSESWEKTKLEWKGKKNKNFGIVKKHLKGGWNWHRGSKWASQPADPGSNLGEISWSLKGIISGGKWSLLKGGAVAE